MYFHPVPWRLVHCFWYHCWYPEIWWCTFLCSNSSLISGFFKDLFVFGVVQYATRCGFLFVYSSWYSLLFLYRFITFSCYGNSQPTSLQHHVFFFSLSILSIKTSDQIYLRPFLCLLTTLSFFHHLIQYFYTTF